MRYAVFADIHGNLEALQAALNYVERQQLSDFVILGDSIGYGANPNECLGWALNNAAFHVLGNHEAAIIVDPLRLDFTDWVRAAIDWTEKKLQPAWDEKLKNLPYLQIAASFALAHGTIHDPERFHYLLAPADACKSFLRMDKPVGFIGHTHIPSVFKESEPVGHHLSEGVFRLKKGERYLLNPGSIGQPRDRDTRLSFGIFDEDELTFEIVRLPYDNKKAAQKILREGLPRSLADRLL